MAKGKGGGGGGSSMQREALALARQQAGMATTMFDESTPIRQEAFGQLQGALEGIDGAPITTSSLAANPAFGALKAAQESSFNQARDRVLSATPAGGGLTSALAGLEGDRAMANASMFGALANDESARRDSITNKALGIATGVPQISMGGLGSAGSLQASMANAQMQRDAQKSGGLGQGLGYIAGSAIGAPGGSKAGAGFNAMGGMEG